MNGEPESYVPLDYRATSKRIAERLIARARVERRRRAAGLLLGAVGVALVAWFLGRFAAVPDSVVLGVGAVLAVASLVTLVRAVDRS